MLTKGFGKKFGFIELGKDIGWISMIEEILFFLTWVSSPRQAGIEIRLDKFRT